MSSRTIFASSGVGFSKSTQRKRLVSAKSVGIRNMGMFSECNRPCVVKAKDRITLGQLGATQPGNARRVDGRGAIGTGGRKVKAVSALRSATALQSASRA